MVAMTVGLETMAVTIDENVSSCSLPAFIDSLSPCARLGRLSFFDTS